MEEFKKGIELEFVSNIDSIINKLKTTKDLAKNVETNFTSKGIPANAKAASFQSSTELFLEAVVRFGKGATKIQQGMGGLSEWLNKAFGTSFMTDFSVSGIISGIVDAFKSAWDELNEMISYNYLSDSSVRSLRLKYGLDSSQAYAVSKASDIFGLKSFEDATFMNTKQLKLFNETVADFQSMYEDYAGDEEFTDSIYAFNINLEKLKIDILKPLMDILVSDTVKNLVKSFTDWVNNGGVDELIEILRSIAKLIIDLLKWFGYIEDENKVPLEEQTQFKEAVTSATASASSGGLNPNTAAYGYAATEKAKKEYQEKQNYIVATRDLQNQPITLNITNNVDGKTISNTSEVITTNNPMNSSNIANTIKGLRTKN